MKKSLFLALLLIVPSFTLASIDFDLKYGSKGDEVTELQEFLIDKGFLTTQSTGNFYTLTQKAVISYQKSVALPSTGFVGPMTRAKINDEINNSQSMSDGEEITETGTSIEPLDTSKQAILQNQIDELINQMDILLEQQKSQLQQNQNFITPNGALITPNGVVLNTSPAPTATPVPVQIVSTSTSAKVLTVFSGIIKNDNLSLKTDFPLNIHSARLIVTDPSTGWQKTYPLYGDVIEASLNHAQDDNQSVYYIYNLSLNPQLKTFVTSDSYFPNGNVILQINSSDADIVSSQPFKLPVSPAIANAITLTF